MWWDGRLIVSKVDVLGLMVHIRGSGLVSMWSRRDIMGRVANRWADEQSESGNSHLILYTPRLAQ